MGSAMEEVAEKLRRMLNVEILKIEEDGNRLVVYVPEDQIRIAVGRGGAAVKAAELVLGRRIEVKSK